jgi:flagellar hook protein FlgE
MKMTLDFSSMTALAGSGTSTVSPTSQDGLALGTLSSYSIDQSGVITGSFSNGMTQALAQVSLANFTNPNGLAKVGGNMFAQSADSGLPQIGAPTTGGRGKISSGYVEMSNVDLSTEFTNMIVAQRGFQANSKIITTSDQMLQDLIGLKQ